MSDVTITLHADPGRGIVRFCVRGKLSVDAARSALAQARASHPGSHRLWDFREADLTDWNFDSMTRFVRLVAARHDGDDAIRVAAVVSRDVDFGLARMYEMMSEAAGTTRHAVFRDLSEAENWLVSG